jgi:hypothetical protein
VLAVTDFSPPAAPLLRGGVPRQREVELRPRGWTAAEAAGRSLAPFITRLNTIRHQNPALRSLRNLRFHDIDNVALLCWSKRDPDSNKCWSSAPMIQGTCR